MDGELDLLRSLDGDIPLARFAGERHLFWSACDGAALAVAHPAEFRQGDAAVGFVELELLGVGVAEAVVAALLLKLWNIGALLKEILVGPLQILEALLQR